MCKTGSNMLRASNLEQRVISTGVLSPAGASRQQEKGCRGTPSVA